MKVSTAYNNFARGKIDHDMIGRYDLPIYQTGSDEFKNFISNFKGNAIYRAGLESYLQFQDCALVEFRFSNTQNYIVVMFANKMRFLSYDVSGNFGWVLDGGAAILEVATPYTLADCKYIARGKPAQNGDAMIFTRNGYEPYKLTRVSANNFTFAPYSRKDDPFPSAWAATKAITGITQATNAVVTCVAHGYTTGQRVLFAGIVGMTQLNAYTATVTNLTANTFSIDVDTTKFTAWSSGGTSALVTAGDYPDNALFYKGRLYYSTTLAKTTTVWASQSGNYFIMTIPTGTTTDIDALQFTIADITQRIEWLFGGDNSLLAGSADGIVACNGGQVNTAITASTVQANITTADGCNRTYPSRKDGLVFYVGLNDRNVYYFSYDLLTESFKAKDANFISYDITLGGFTKIRFKKDRNDLIYTLRGGTDFCSVNFKESENIVGWHEHSTSGTITDMALITNNMGTPQIFVLALRNGNYFIEHQADYVEFNHRVNFFTGKTLAAKLLDDQAYNRYVAEQLRSCVYLDNALSYKDLRATTITYNSGAGTITASGASFLVGDVGKHIAYKTSTGYEYGRFLITGYTSATVVTVSVLQTPTTNVWSSWYLSFNSLSGLAQYNGQTVSVVADGGYLTDQAISGGATTFSKQITSVVLGYKYKGLIKTFIQGFAVQGTNTQTTYKAVSRVGVRTVSSAGVFIGTSLYAMEPVQELSPVDLNYLPPLPMDGTKYVNFSDDTEIDKYFYVVQEEPLPLNLAALLLETDYAVKS